MSDIIRITIDGRAIDGRPGQTVLEAAQSVGIYIPRLCHREGLTPAGTCRVCMVTVNGRPQSACTLPISAGMVIENDTPQLREYRRRIIEMLFVEGNHFCMFCEKSGNCELQALAYRFGITAPRYPYQFPRRAVDASHPDVLIDHNRCILCSRCIRASRDLDGKNVFQFVGRGAHKRVGINARARLRDTGLDVSDQAVEACPVGAILKKRTGYLVPIGMRLYDHQPIGAEIETAGTAKE